LAKLGSEEGKPNGLVEMPFERESILSFLAPRPVGVLWGIGEQTEARLKHFGIVTCADLQRAPLARLERILASRHAAESAHRLAMGESDERVFYEEERAQSVSREFTFPEDETDRGKIRQKLLELVVDVGRMFRRERRWARTARLKLRDEAFQTRTRQAAFDTPARDDISFREKALELFEKEPIGSLRLIGFGVANFQDDADERGPSLFASPDDEKRRKRERLSDALDARQLPHATCFLRLAGSTDCSCRLPNSPCEAANSLAQRAVPAEGHCPATDFITLSTEFRQRVQERNLERTGTLGFRKRAFADHFHQF